MKRSAPHDESHASFLVWLSSSRPGGRRSAHRSAATLTNRSAKPPAASSVSMSSKREPAEAFRWSSSRRSTRFAILPTAMASLAFDEPGLFNRKVFFTITSHGYEVEKDGFGYRGKALESRKAARPTS